MKDKFLIINDFKQGWQRRIDPTQIPIGAAQESNNITLTDRGGISPRKGELLLGTAESGAGIVSMYSFKKANSNDILIKTFDTVIKYYSNLTLDWELLQDGYTDRLFFGFKELTAADDILEWLYFGNGVEPYSRWCGYEAQITSVLLGGETTIPVTTTILPTSSFSGTATSVTTTTITMPSMTWATDIFNLFYVRITDGASQGAISLIQATTETTITFNTIAGLAGTPTFEIVQLALPVSYFRGTATASTTTTIDVAGTPWQTNAWAGSYVVITSGAADKQVSLISSNTTSQITFATIPTLAGTPTFEIQAESTYQLPRQVIYDGNKVTYTAVPTDASITTSAAVATPINTAITVTPQTFPEDPRGNILETNINQMFVAGIPSQPNTTYRSTLNDPTDFFFSSPRSADEGDILFFPYLGHKISDIKSQEDFLYVIKRDSIEALTYTQDNNDVAQINKIIQGVNVGTEGRAWRMENDIAFITPDNRITTIGRIKLRDVRPQINDIAYSINRAMDAFSGDEAFGEEYRERAFVGLKSSPEVVNNDILLVRNKDYQSWEGIWFISAAAVVAHESLLYYGASYTPDVYQMQYGINKVKGDETFPMDCSWTSGWINLNQTGFYVEELSNIMIEGYITSGTTIKINLFKDFAESSFQNLVISGLDTTFQDGLPSFSFMGGDPLGLLPLGAGSTLGDPDPEGRRHFIVSLPFPITQCEYVAIEVASNGLAQSWEIIGLGINTTNLAFENQARIVNEV